jgi:protein AroM
MTQKTIGALTIGQSPRPDLVAPLENLLPRCRILQAGALDGFSLEELPDTTNAAFPLVTQIQDGSVVTVEESFIAPKLQQALEQLEAQGVAATLLLCAGTFAHLQSRRLLFKPFEIGCGVLRALGMKSLGLIAPFVEQESPIRQRWEKSGWQTTVWTADLGNQDRAFHQQLSDHIQTNELECILLDYVGHPLGQVTQLQRSIDLPVLDLGYLAMVTLASTL